MIDKKHKRPTSFTTCFSMYSIYVSFSRLRCVSSPPESLALPDLSSPHLVSLSIVAAQITTKVIVGEP